jgi:CubicO group peptidase (beta-lactamase class C family)
MAAEAAQRDPSVVDWPDRAMTLGGALPRALVSSDGGFNDPRIMAAGIPGAGGIATARALATIWSSVVTPTDGVRLLSDDTIEIATKVQTQGPPVFEAVPPFHRWGMGFRLDSAARRCVTSAGFGHDGAGGQVAFAEPDLKLGFAFTTNFAVADDMRGTSIVDALRVALA